MANHASARKRIRTNARRKDINIARRSRIRTFTKKIELALAAGDAVKAQEAFQAAQPEMQRGAARGIINIKTVSRKLSRLSARIKAIK
jgi:small subunit ribosomal protein S20